MSKALGKLVSNAPGYIEGFITGSKPRIAVFLKYAKVELAPPTPGDIPKAIGGLRQGLSSLRSGRYKQLTVKEALLNTLVVGEVCLWFFVGECIGKRSIIGYQV